MERVQGGFSTGPERYTPIPREAEKPSCQASRLRLTVVMIRRGFLDSYSRKDLTELARDGPAAHRLARRANALVLLDDGMSCEAIGKVLLLDDDTIRTWHRLYEEEGIEDLASFGYEGSACRLSGEQQDKLKAWITETLPRTTREVGAWIENECGHRVTRAVLAWSRCCIAPWRRSRPRRQGTSTRLRKCTERAT